MCTPLKLEFRASVSHPKWVLGTELGSFAVAVCALHCRPYLFSPNDCYEKKQKRNKKVPRFEEDTEMLEPSCIADENVKWASHNGNSMIIPLKIKHKITIRSKSCISECILSRGGSAD